MKTHRSSRELAVWGLLALCGGFAADVTSVRATAVQGTVLILMLVAFALTLPGRAPALLVAVLTALPFPILQFYRQHQLDVGYAILLIPAAIAAFGGRLAGRWLDTAASQLSKSELDSKAPDSWHPLPKRFVLAVALVIIAASGLSSVATRLHALAHPAAAWLALVWQIMTLLGWIGFTPLILETGKQDEVGLTASVALKHIAVLGALAVVHAVAVVTISGVLFIPLVPSWNALVRAAFLTYLPLDMLVYVAVLSLGYVSDVERWRRESARREAALRAESTESRMSALRARLNPHFLFNALNSVDVLARAGKTSEMSTVLDGLTGLLRYVLDEHRASVPLGDELAFVRRYLGVQHVRFGDRLRYSVVAQADAERAAVPQLLLQPIVENAVEHGIAQTLDGGTVSVEANRHGDVLELIVEDDGVGVPREPSKKGLGLSSSRERLARLFGARATLSVGPRLQGGGTRAVIRLPYEAVDTT